MLWKQKHWLYQYGMENHSDSFLNIDSNKFPLDTQALLSNLSEMSISHTYILSVTLTVWHSRDTSTDAWSYMQ